MLLSSEKSELRKFIAKAKAEYIEWGIGLKTGLPSTVMVSDTDYGRPMKPFCIETPNFWEWAERLGRFFSLFNHFFY